MPENLLPQSAPEKQYKLTLGVKSIVTIQHALAQLIEATRQTMNDPSNTPGVKAARNMEFEAYVEARDKIGFQVGQADATDQQLKSDKRRRS